MLHGYGVAGLQGCGALRKAFFSNGSAAHPWVVEAPQRKAAYLYYIKGMRKFLCETHWGVRIMSDRPALVLIVDKKHSYQLFCFQVNS